MTEATNPGFSFGKEWSSCNSLSFSVKDIMIEVSISLVVCIAIGFMVREKTL